MPPPQPQPYRYRSALKQLSTTRATPRSYPQNRILPVSHQLRVRRHGPLGTDRTPSTRAPQRTMSGTPTHSGSSAPDSNDQAPNLPYRPYRRAQASHVSHASQAAAPSPAPAAGSSSAGAVSAARQAYESGPTTLTGYHVRARASSFLQGLAAGPGPAAPSPSLSPSSSAVRSYASESGRRRDSAASGSGTSRGFGPYSAEEPSPGSAQASPSPGRSSAPAASRARNLNLNLNLSTVAAVASRAKARAREGVSRVGESWNNGAGPGAGPGRTRDVGGDAWDEAGLARGGRAGAGAGEGGEVGWRQARTLAGGGGSGAPDSRERQPHTVRRDQRWGQEAGELENGQQQEEAERATSPSAPGFDGMSPLLGAIDAPPSSRPSNAPAIPARPHAHPASSRAGAAPARSEDRTPLAAPSSSGGLSASAETGLDLDAGYGSPRTPTAADQPQPRPPGVISAALETPRSSAATTAPARPASRPTSSSSSSSYSGAAARSGPPVPPSPALAQRAQAQPLGAGQGQAAAPLNFGSAAQVATAGKRLAKGLQTSLKRLNTYAVGTGAGWASELAAAGLLDGQGVDGKQAAMSSSAAGLGAGAGAGAGASASAPNSRASTPPPGPLIAASPSAWSSAAPLLARSRQRENAQQVPVMTDWLATEDLPTAEFSVAANNDSDAAARSQSRGSTPARPLAILPLSQAQGQGRKNRPASALRSNTSPPTLPFSSSSNSSRVGFGAGTGSVPRSPAFLSTSFGSQASSLGASHRAPLSTSAQHRSQTQPPGAAASGAGSTVDPAAAAAGADAAFVPVAPGMPSHAPGTTVPVLLPGYVTRRVARDRHPQSWARVEPVEDLDDGEVEMDVYVHGIVLRSLEHVGTRQRMFNQMAKQVSAVAPPVYWTNAARDPPTHKLPPTPTHSSQACRRSRACPPRRARTRSPSATRPS